MKLDHTLKTFFPKNNFNHHYLWEKALFSFNHSFDASKDIWKTTMLRYSKAMGWSLNSFQSCEWKAQNIVGVRWNYFKLTGTTSHLHKKICHCKLMSMDYY